MKGTSKAIVCTCCGATFMELGAIQTRLIEELKSRALYHDTDSVFTPASPVKVYTYNRGSKFPFGKGKKGNR